MRYALLLCLLTLTACSTVSPAQNARNDSLFQAAKACQTGSLVVTGISVDGTPETRTMGSGGSDRQNYDKCYAEKSAPIWKDYCSKNPGVAGCAGR